MQIRPPVVLLAALLCACTPQQHLLFSLLPDGTIPALLSQFDGLAETNRRRIGEFEMKGDWQGLAQFAEENLAKDRRNADWWFVAGYAYTRLGHHARAAECYGEMVRIDPQEAAGWHSLAQALRADKQPERAVRVLQQYLLVDRKQATTFLILGESLSDMRRWGDAVPAYREALDLDGGSPDALYGWGRAHARLGRMAEAKEALAALERASPEHAARLARDIGEVSGTSAPVSGAAR